MIFFQDHQLLKDLGMLIFYVVISYFYMFINWDFVFHEESFEAADVLKTSAKIIPEWYFLVFFGMIKGVPHKFGGLVWLIIVMLCLTYGLVAGIFYLTNYKHLWTSLHVLLLLMVLYIISCLAAQMLLLCPCKSYS